MEGNVLREIYEVFDSRIGYHGSNSRLFEDIDIAKEYIAKHYLDLQNKLDITGDKNRTFEIFDHSLDEYDIYPNRIGSLTFEYFPVQLDVGDERWSDEYEIILEKRELVTG